MEYNIIRKKSVTSTNTLLKELARDVPHGTVLCADSQSRGRGRMGRSFYSPDKEGIYMSILLKEGFGNNPTLVTTLTAVSVMKAISNLTGKEPFVKWVNDIILDGKKVCGILTEGAFNGKELEYMIVGIGVNVGNSSFPDEIKDIAGSINCDKELLLEEIIRCFFEEYKNLSSGEYLDFYRKRCISLDRPIKIISPGKEPVEAFSQGIDDNANLIVKYPDGRVDTVFSGEVKTCL